MYQIKDKKVQTKTQNQEKHRGPPMNIEPRRQTLGSFFYFTDYVFAKQTRLSDPI